MMHFSGHYSAAQRTEDLCAIHYLTTQENLTTQFLIKRKHSYFTDTVHTVQEKQ